jgi:CRP-like cAMP-binding protein
MQKTPLSPQAPQGSTAASAALREAKDRGAQLLAEGKLEAALAAFQQVAKAAPEDLHSRQRMAEVLQRLGRTREAIAEYQALAEAWANQGFALRAIALCKVILQLEPRHTRTQALLADLYAHSSRHRAPVRVSAPAPAAEPVKAAPEVAADEEEVARLAPVPLFSALGREAFLEVLAGMERRTFQAGEVVVREGEPGTSMFVIVEGGADVVRQEEGGVLTTVARMGEGEFFGEMALLAEGPRLAGVVAVGQTVLLELSRQRMADVIARHPAVGEVVQQFYRERLLTNVMRSNPLFTQMPEELRLAVREAFTPLTVKEGEVILTRGQPAQALFLVLRGRCEVFHAHMDGHETPYPDMVEGDVFGEVSLLRSKLVTASVRAAAPSILLKLERDTFEQLLDKHPALRQELQRLGSERLFRTAQLLSKRPILPGDARV